MDLNIVIKIDFFLNNIIYLSMNNIVKQALTIPYIGLAKFNNHTFKQNRDWKNKKMWKGSVYGFETFPPEFIPLNSWIFIIEMNNETNHIVGIGRLRSSATKSLHTRHRGFMVVSCVRPSLRR